MNQSSVARATIGRLPLYLKYLKSLPEERTTVSSTIIAKALGLGEVQVRKDLSSVSGKGRPKIGYVTKELIENLESSIGHRSRSRAVIVGTGKLGKALLTYGGFSNYGLEIAAGFDIEADKINAKGLGKVYSINEFKIFCQKEDIKLGIITVPKASAQNVCDMMVEAGIEAVWNFAPVTLSVPQNVLVKYEDIALSLAYLEEQLRQRKTKN